MFHTFRTRVNQIAVFLQMLAITAFFVVGLMAMALL
jgi:hypothetical protein